MKIKFHSNQWTQIIMSYRQKANCLYWWLLVALIKVLFKEQPRFQLLFHINCMTGVITIALYYKERSITKTMFKTAVIHPSIMLNDCAYSSCMCVYLLACNWIRQIQWCQDKGNYFDNDFCFFITWRVTKILN